MIILLAVETVVPFPSKGCNWKQIPPHEVAAMAERKEHYPLSPYGMKLGKDGWKWCGGERVESGVPYIALTKI